MGEVHTKNTLKKIPSLSCFQVLLLLLLLLQRFPGYRHVVAMSRSTSQLNGPDRSITMKTFFPFFPGNSAEPISIARIPSDPLRPLPRALWAQCDALARN